MGCLLLLGFKIRLVMTGPSACMTLMAYFWIDILYGLCLIGIGLVATSIWHRFGVLKMLVGATVCILMIITWLAVGDGSSVFSYVMNEHFAFAHILAGVGLLCIFGFYLLMRNSPIERSPSKRRISGLWAEK